MLEQRILVLEQQLSAANDASAKLTLANVELTKLLSEAESRFKKLRRNSRNDESSLRAQLTTAQTRRG